MLKAVEMTSQEAPWFLLRQEMSQKSCEVAYITMCYSEEKVRARKTNTELANLPPASTNVWKGNVIQKYEKKPQAIDNVYLAEFVSSYTFNNRQKTYLARRKDCVIRYRHFMPDNVMNYKRKQVTLFIPFRSEAVEILDGNAFLQTYSENLDLNVNRQKYIYDADCDAMYELAKSIDMQEWGSGRVQRK